jgi:hypothetical protein
MNKKEAIESLRNQGYQAFERDWVLGETIEVASEPDSAEGEITVHRRIAWLVRHQDLWVVEESHLVPAEPYRSEPLKLSAACEHVKKVLSKPRGSL